MTTDAPQPDQFVSQTPASEEQTVHYLPPRKMRKRRGMKLQMTSMIDIVFNLLIFFLVATEFNPEGLLPSDLPREGVGTVNEDIPKLPIKIRISSIGEGQNDAHLAIEGVASEPSGFEQLFSVLHAMQSGQGGLYEQDTPVVLMGSSDTYWEHMVLAYNAAVKARYTDISFAPAR